MAEELGEKTEAPTGRRLSEARQKGQLARSMELSGAIDLIGAVLLIFVFGEDLVTGLGEMVRAVLSGRAPGAEPIDATVEPLVVWSLATGVRIAAPLIAMMAAIIYAAHLHQVGWLVTLRPLEPQMNRLNPLKGLGRLFSRRNTVKGVLGIVKLVLLGVVVWMVIAERFPQIAALPALDLVPAYRLMGRIVMELAAWMLLLMLALGLADYTYQKWQHGQDLKMTKQEVKEERKSSEGDPDVKGRRLKMARSFLLQQVRSAVPRADVVVTNPTHFSVALKYDPETMAAPRVVAKGADYMAFRIREVASAHGVPIVEKPALARLLYAKVEVGQEVRPEYYQAVAEVLAYVYRLNQHAAA